MCGHCRKQEARGGGREGGREGNVPALGRGDSLHDEDSVGLEQAADIHIGRKEGGKEGGREGLATNVPALGRGDGLHDKDAVGLEQATDGVEVLA